MESLLETKKHKCVYCGKVLVKIGRKRVNGKNHDDWDDRKYHKKCFKIISDRGDIIKKYELKIEFI